MDKIYQKSFFGAKNAGFTLIELLVVVLIIGILAAVALPQYEKAAEKSRAAEGIVLARSIALANQRYYMANGEWATDINDLDLDFPGQDEQQIDIPTKTTKYFSCRAVGVSMPAVMAACRRKNSAYFYAIVYYKTDPNQAVCLSSNVASGVKICRLLTGKTEAPYTF